VVLGFNALADAGDQLSRRTGEILATLDCFAAFLEAVAQTFCSVMPAIGSLVHWLISL
jgi:hypothetical protein